MYSTIQTVHSYWAYVALILIFLAVINAIIGFTGNKEFTTKDRKISLFGLISAHIQLVLGLILVFVSPYFEQATNGGNVMKDAVLRLYLVEHPMMNIIAIILITIAWSKHKKIAESKGKFKTISLYYGIGLVLLLSRIPWSAWFS